MRAQFFKPVSANSHMAVFAGSSFVIGFDCPDRRGALIPAKLPKNQSAHVKPPGGRQAKNEKPSQSP